MKQTVRWGVLGAARIATGKMIPAMKESPSASLLALASRDGEKGRTVAQELGVARVYEGYDDLLADGEVDAIYVPLPNHLHFEWSRRAMEAGKHVLCEKPLCLTAKEVAQLCRVRDQTGRQIEEGFAFRNHPQWTKLDELLTAKAIGSVRAVHATLAKQFFDPSDIRNKLDAGGGALYDLGSYAISACNLIFKRSPRRVISAIDRDSSFGTDRLTTALLDYGDSHATFTVASQAGPSSWATHQQLTVVGATGWLRFNFPYAQGKPTACSIEVGDAASVGCVPTATFSFKPVNQYALQIERFSRLVLGHAVPSWPIEDSLAILRTIEALFESARSGVWRSLRE